MFLRSGKETSKKQNPFCYFLTPTARLLRVDVTKEVFIVDAFKTVRFTAGLKFKLAIFSSLLNTQKSKLGKDYQTLPRARVFNESRSNAENFYFPESGSFELKWPLCKGEEAANL